jgi:Flp pilus assembly pilin Flp
MTALFTSLMNDEAGFIISAELVIVATVAVLAMVVGLSEVGINVNNELEDVGSAFGSMNQSMNLQGTTGHQSMVGGSMFQDRLDYCDESCDVVTGSHIDYEQ